MSSPNSPEESESKGNTNDTEGFKDLSSNCYSPTNATSKLFFAIWNKHYSKNRQCTEFL